MAFCSNVWSQIKIYKTALIIYFIATLNQIRKFEKCFNFIYLHIVPASKQLVITYASDAMYKAEICLLNSSNK